MQAKIGVRVLVVLAILGFIALSYPFLKELKGSDSERKKVEVIVPSGMSFYELSLMLEKRGVVKSAYILRIYASKSGVDRTLQPGRYVFASPSDYKSVVETIKKGPAVELVKVTVPEGYSNKQIADLMSRSFGIDSDEFLTHVNTRKDVYESKYPFLRAVPGNSLEGFLFPDTYFFKKNATVEEITNAMLANFVKKSLEIGLLKSADEENQELYEVVIMASIVEKEAKLKEERPLIASVFYNRLRKGMKLQSCATVEYLFEFKKPNLTLEDLKVDSPYNTYIHSGLPPTPICNPGSDSLKAALNPADTDYLYFVLADESGRHYFAETYSEFLKYKSKRKK